MDEPIQSIVAVAEVPRISAHSLRRTWENLLRRAGVDQLVRRSLAGWRTEEAQAIYATVDPEERRAASEVSFSSSWGRGHGHEACRVYLPGTVAVVRTLWMDGRHGRARTFGSDES